MLIKYPVDVQETMGFNEKSRVFGLEGCERTTNLNDEINLINAIAKNAHR